MGFKRELVCDGPHSAWDLDNPIDVPHRIELHTLTSDHSQLPPHWVEVSLPLNDTVADARTVLFFADIMCAARKLWELRDEEERQRQEEEIAAEQREAVKA